MADENTSVGKISLDIDLSQDLEKEIGNAANRITEGLQSGVEKGFNLNNIMKSLTDNINNTVKTTMDSVKSTIESSLKASSDNITSSINSIKEQAIGAINTITESLKNIKVPQQTFTSPANTTAPQSVFQGNTTQPRAPTSKITTPKVNTVDFERVRTQIEGLTQQIDITNKRIEQQRAKLAGLKEAYERAFNEGKKSKLEEQILTTEQRINSLTRVSDKLGFKLSDLDTQFKAMGSSAEVAGNGVNDLNNKLNKTSTKLKETESSTKKSNSMLDKLGLSFGQVGRMMDRMILRMAIFNTVINGLGRLATFTGNALITNSAFSNSLAQVKSNLEVAFMPIYNAILPAITTLMNALARATTYLAVFTSTLFGTTYKASAAAATGLNSNIAKYQQLQKESGKYGDSAEKAAKKAKNSLGGFDEINVLSSAKDSTAGGAGGAGGGLPSVKAPMPIVAPPINTKGIEKFAEKVKTILAKIEVWMKKHKVLIEVIAVAIGSFVIAIGVAKLAMGVVAGFGAIIAFLTSPIFLVVLAITAVIAIVILLIKHWDIVEKAAKKAWSGIVEVWNTVAKWFDTNVISPLAKFFKGLWDGIVSVFSNTKKWFSDVFIGAWEGIKHAFSGVGSFFGGLWDIIKEKFTTIGSVIGNAIGGAFKTVVNSIIGFAEDTINGFIRAINSAIKLINKIPGVKIETIKTLSIPKLAKGGIVDGATPFIAGEAGKEAVMPLENNTGWISQLAGRIGSLIPSMQQPQLAFAPSGNVQATQQTSSPTNDRYSIKNEIKEAVIEAIKTIKNNDNGGNDNSNLIFNVDGDTWAKISIKQLNKRRKRTGITELEV